MRPTIPFAVALAALGLAGCTPAPGEDPSLLFNRVWVDSTPEKPTDYMQAAFVVSRPALGIFQRASRYDMHLERFDYQRDGERLELTFPQTGKAAEITFAIRACNTLPSFDLCLDLSDNPWGGPKHYFGRRAQDDDETLREMRAHLPER
jgi:hypothetical protein